MSRLPASWRRRMVASRPSRRVHFEGARQPGLFLRPAEVARRPRPLSASRRSRRRRTRPGFKAAHEAYSAALNKAMSLSAALMKNFGAASGGATEAETSFLPKMFDPQAWGGPQPPSRSGADRPLP